MKTLLTTLFSLVVSGSVVFAWDAPAMNKQIEQTNFIVNEGCSGTLVSVAEKVVLTNFHCITKNVDTRERNAVDSKGVVRKIRERIFTDVKVEQKHYDGFSFVGSSTFTAEILVADELHDLGVLRLKGSIPHTTASPILPDGDAVIRGERIYIVGNPVGLDATVVEGIVSNTNRRVALPWTNGQMLPLIQHSGGTWFGNSGGALYNSRGFLIGIPVAIMGQTSHLGLSLPMNEVVKPILRANCLARVFDPKADDKACEVQRQKDEVKHAPQ